MAFPTTGRFQTGEPQAQRLPFTHSLVDHLRQMLAGERLMIEMSDLDAIEDQALAMFGISVEYFMDERVINHA